MRLPSRSVILAVAPLLVAGCLVGHKAPEDDPDVDFLFNAFEDQGWNVTVTRGAVACFAPGPPLQSLTYAVTSIKTERDSDFDGLDDGEEYQWGSDPRSADTDGDGLTDRREVDLNNEATFERPGGLKPYRADSDGDCLRDGDEVNGTHVPGIGLRSTDPTGPDTDRDGLSDPEEILQTHSDPLNADTDGDGADDETDVDALHNVAVRLRFESLMLKKGSGVVGVLFNFSFPTPEGALVADHPPVFNATVDENQTLASQYSPALVDVEDASGNETIFVYFSLAKAENGRAIDVAPNSTQPNVWMYVDPIAKRWTGSGENRPADGSWITLETSEARLGFRVAVEAL